ncbi:MAG: PD40 domain-containing protein, partial [Crocinitomicaceae bacterium]|nr:PD40 domain-containing protein [Crocinitomicaceae bacterium]
MMHHFYRLTLSLLFVLTLTFVNGKSLEVSPPDSTTSFVNKTAAAYIVEEGKTLYGEGKIREALIKFRQATIKDPNSWKAAYWVSKCHYRINNYGYALKYAKEAIRLSGDKIYNEIYYSLASTHHRLGNIDTALINYKLAKEYLSKSRANVLTIDHQILECEFALEQMKKEPVYTRTRVAGEINSGFDDYNVVLASDGQSMYFTSRRSNTTGGGMNPDDQRYFEDNYKVEYNAATNEWENITNELGKLNSKGFDALNYISPDGLYGVLTLNNTALDIKKTTRGSDLCELKLNNKGTWNKPKSIKNKTINTSFFEGSATLTADRNTMYFVSDRKGEKSSTDIYVVEKVGKKWGEAKPLPMNVNTTARETTPYITPDGRYLFFGSD